MVKAWQSKVDKRLGVRGQWGIALGVIPLVVLGLVFWGKSRSERPRHVDAPTTSLEVNFQRRAPAETCPDCKGAEPAKSACTTCRQIGTAPASEQ